MRVADMRALVRFLAIGVAFFPDVNASPQRSGVAGALVRGGPESASWPVPPRPKGPPRPSPAIGPGTTPVNASFDPSLIEPKEPLTNSQRLNVAADCAGPVSSKPSTFWMDDMDHNGDARGYAPFLDNFYTYKTWRNVVRDYGVRNDGTGDQTAVIQSAMNDDSRGGNRFKGPLTAQPAHVYLPGGTYTLASKLDLRKGTIVMGDPQNPPVLKASSNFNGEIVVDGYDIASAPETSFMIQLRNVIIDTTALPASRKLVALQWGVAQGCALGNVDIRMPTNSAGHTGILLQAGSTIAVTDVRITGGAVGIQNQNQQVNFKNIYFKSCSTAYYAPSGFNSVLQGVTFDTCGVGIDVSGNHNLNDQKDHGDVILLDSVSTNSGNTIVFRDISTAGGQRNNQIVIQNLKHDTNNPIAVKHQTNEVVLSARATVDTWVWGNSIPPGVFATGNSYTISRPASLLDSLGRFFMKDAPTYANYATDQIVNVKSVPGFEVKGDGRTDDGPALNAILAQNAANCKITYFPYGVYIVTDTLLIPPNSRIVGEAWPVVSGAGPNFNNVNSPRPVVKVGNLNDIGVAQINDMRFTVREPLKGAKILEVNMAGNSPGDVGLWNVIVNIGGFKDSTVATVCQSQDTTNCMAAFAGAHFTATSSAYAQNLWVWTADHSEDGGPRQIISTGRGILVEATKGTWLPGTGSEHHWLYQYNFNNARNVYVGLLQSESPYMQGRGAVKLAPVPWLANLNIGDPDFSWCAGNDGYCRTAFGINVNGGDGLFLYSSAAWAFFDGEWNEEYGAQCANGDCQQSMNRVSGTPRGLYWFGMNTKAANQMVLDGKGNPKQANNPGSWGGNLVAYRQFW